MSKKQQRTRMKPVKRGSLGTSSRTWIFIGVAIVAIIAAVMIGVPQSPPKPDRVDTTANTPAPDFSESQAFSRQGELRFLAPDGKERGRIDIEVKDDNEERARGMMFRQQLDEDQGMLFIFPVSQVLTFWMKNTPLSLDMVFVDSYHEVVSISRETTPFAETVYASEKPAQYVVEVNAGYCARHGVQVGDRVEWTTTP